MPRCPACSVPLTRVEESADGTTLRSQVCPQCFGTWVPHVALLRRANSDAAWAQAHLGDPLPAQTNPAAASLQDLAAVVAEGDTAQELRCPSCNKMLQKDRFHPLIPLVIDRCKACGYSWLRAGEIPMICRLYAQLMSSDDPKIVQVRERWQTMAGFDALSRGHAAGQHGPTEAVGGIDTLSMLFDLLKSL